MITRLGKIVGEMKKGEWGMVHEFVPTEEERIEKYGKLIVVVGLRVDAGEGEEGRKEVVETGREVLARLHELYYGDEEKGVLVRLKKSVEKIVEEFGGGEIGCVVEVKGIVYVVMVGGGGVWTKNGNKEGWLLAPGRRDVEGVVLGMSGWAKEGQILVLGNKRFWDRLPGGVLRVAMSNLENTEKGGMEAVVETLGAVEHGGGEGGGEVGAVVRFERGAEEAEEIEEEKVEPIKTETLGRQIVEEERFVKRTNWLEEVKKRANELRTKVIPDKPVFIVNQGGGGGEYKKKKIIYVGLGFLVVLALLFGIGKVRGRVEGEKKSLANETIEKLVFKFRDADALVGLNPIRSRELLVEVQSGIDELSEVAKKDQRVVEIVQKMGEVLGAASGTKKAELVEVLDLELLRSGMGVVGMVEGEANKLWVLDGEGDRLVEVDTNKKSGKMVAGKDSLGEVEGLAYYPGKIAVWGEKGIVECNVETGGCEVKIKKDDGWGKILDLETWAGNLYVLDAGNKEIWKYQGGELGYGVKQRWIAEGENGGLENAKTMTVDGNIWVAGNQTLYKFTRGVGESVGLSGWDKPWGEKIKMVTDESAEKLYVLDAQNGRVVAMSKAGEYEGVWVSEKLKEAIDLVVNESLGKMFVTDAKHVWEIKL